MVKFVAGLVPTNPASEFVAEITYSTNTPSITWTPDYPDSRTYTVEGKTNLTDAAWMMPTNAAHRFFRVKVEMK